MRVECKICGYELDYIGIYEPELECPICLTKTFVDYVEIVGKAYISRHFKLWNNYSISQHDDLPDEHVTNYPDFITFPTISC